MTFAVHRGHVGAFRDKIFDQRDISSRGGVVKRRIPLMVPRVDVRAARFDEKPNAGQKPGRMVAMLVCGESLPVTGT